MGYLVWEAFLGKVTFELSFQSEITKPILPSEEPSADTPCVCAQSCLALCDPMDCSPPGSYLHGILQARILEWVAIHSSSGSSQPMYQTWVSSITGGFFAAEPPGKVK